MATLVVKIGTSSLTQPTSGHLALATLGSLVETLCTLRQQGYRVVLVSSGAVGVGCQRLGLRERPASLIQKQAIAAVGQGRLMRVYDDLFTALNQPIAQVLLTREDLGERHRYLNALNTFRALLNLGVIPIVNENDTVAVEELRFGDNDTLSALVAALIEAEWLFLLTDVDRLYAADPRQHPDAPPIPLVESPRALAALKGSATTGGSGWGTGGMATKLTAAEIASANGIRTVVTEGRQPQNLLRILAGENLGTHILPQAQTPSARKRWIAHGLVPAGRLLLDQGATVAIAERGKSLLPAGIVGVEGEFPAQVAVSLCDPAGQEIGRGLVNYSSGELRQILGRQSDEVPEILGYYGAETAVHRDNLVVLP